MKVIAQQVNTLGNRLFYDHSKKYPEWDIMVLFSFGKNGTLGSYPSQYSNYQLNTTGPDGYSYGSFDAVNNFMNGSLNIYNGTSHIPTGILGTQLMINSDCNLKVLTTNIYPLNPTSTGKSCAVYDCISGTGQHLRIIASQFDYPDTQNNVHNESQLSNLIETYGLTDNTVIVGQLSIAKKYVSDICDRYGYSLAPFSATNTYFDDDVRALTCQIYVLTNRINILNSNVINAGACIPDIGGDLTQTDWMALYADLDFVVPKNSGVSSFMSYTTVPTATAVVNKTTYDAPS